MTLEEKLVEKIDNKAKRADVNRSQMMEDIVESYFQQKGVDTAVVFCGDDENQTMNLYQGKPVLSHILDHLSEEGISRVFLLAGHNRDEIESNYGSKYSGLALEYVSEEKPSGTAAALEKVGDKIDDTFVALNGHVVTDVDLRDMLEVHNDENAVATMALTTVENPSKYGVARLKGRQILGFEEKPEAGEEPSRLINAGTYIMEPDIFSRLDVDDLEEVFEDLSQAGELAGYIYGGKWVDAGER